MNSPLSAHTRRVALSLFAAGIVATSGSAWASTIESADVYTGTISAHSSGLSVTAPIIIATGSVLNLEGSGGYISGSSSISAVSFHGDGSHLSGSLNVFGVAADHAFTGANTFTSSFSVQSGGRQISISTGSTSDIISISSAGALTFTPEFHNSSSTILLFGDNTMNSSMGPCVLASTLTIVTTGGRVEVYFSGYMRGTAFNATGLIAFLVDGAFPDEMTSEKGFGFRVDQTNTPNNMIGFDYLLDNLSAGPHSFCLTISAKYVGGGTTLWGALGGTNPANMFYVKEIK